MGADFLDRPFPLPCLPCQALRSRRDLSPAFCSPLLPPPAHAVGGRIHRLEISMKTPSSSTSLMSLPPWVISSFISSRRGERCLALLHGPHAELTLDTVFTYVSAFLSKLCDGKKYRAKDMLHDFGWEDATDAEKTCFGLCLAHLVAAGLLPLVQHQTPSGSGSHRYIFRPSPSSES